MNCPKCNTQMLEDGENYKCPKCGKSYKYSMETVNLSDYISSEKIACMNCGKYKKLTDRICPHCGSDSKTMPKKQKKKGKGAGIVIAILLLAAIGFLFYNFKDEIIRKYNEITEKIEQNKTQKENNDETKNDNNNDNSKCEEGYECVTQDGVIYRFSIKKEIKIDEMYNYDTSELERGILKITDDGELVFENAENKIIKKFDNIEGKVTSIETNESCDEKFYLAVTSDGKIYRSEKHEGLLIEEPFYLLEQNHEVSRVSLYAYNCSDEITIFTKQREILKLYE